MYNHYHSPFSVGVNTSNFDNVYVSQNNSMWCWAACLEMIMRHYGIDVSQDEFAKHTCGVNRYGIPANCPASFDVITKNLNVFWEDTFTKYNLSAKLNYGSPDLYRVYQELENNNPVIVAYRNSNSNIGHAVLITGMEGYFLLDSIVVTKFIIRDPWPRLENIFTSGRKEEENTHELVNRIYAHWYPNLTLNGMNQLLHLIA